LLGRSNSVTSFQPARDLASSPFVSDLFSNNAGMAPTADGDVNWRVAARVLVCFVFDKNFLDSFGGTHVGS
jgi:hypothetical protein